MWKKSCAYFLLLSDKISNGSIYLTQCAAVKTTRVDNKDPPQVNCFSLSEDFFNIIIIQGNSPKSVLILSGTKRSLLIFLFAKRDIN